MFEKKWRGLNVDINCPMLFGPSYKSLTHCDPDGDDSSGFSKTHCHLKSRIFFLLLQRFREFSWELDHKWASHVA